MVLVPLVFRSDCGIDMPAPGRQLIGRLNPTMRSGFIRRAPSTEGPAKEWGFAKRLAPSWTPK